MNPELRPDYAGGSIVNLAASIATALGAPATGYPPLRGLAPTDLVSRRNILLLVIDGLGYDYLTDRGRGSWMARQLAGRLTSVFPPTTASAIPALLTGRAPQQHGFVGWFTYFRELGSQLAVLPLRRRGSREAVEIDPRALSGIEPLYPQMGAHAACVSPEWIAHSGFNRAYSEGAEIHSYRDLPGFFDRIEALLTGPERRYIYAYWPDFDRLAHEFGVASPEVQQHFRELDLALAGFCGRAGGSDTALLLSADHGFIDTDPAATLDLADHPRLAECLALPLSGEPRTAYCHLRPGAEAVFLDYLRRNLAAEVEALPSRQLIAGGWFGLGPPHPRLAERIGDYTLLLRGHYSIREWLLAERPYRQIGVHGGLSAAEIYVPLVRQDL
jgi:hypothetical protein